MAEPALAFVVRRDPSPHGKPRLAPILVALALWLSAHPTEAENQLVVSDANGKRVAFVIGTGPNGFDPSSYPLSPGESEKWV